MTTLNNGKIIVDDLDELRIIVEEKKIPLELIDIKESGLKSLEVLFDGIDEINGSIDNWDVSSITYLGATFWDSSFDCDLSNWDVSNVTDMTKTFSYSKFNGDLSNWDVSNVETMEGMFFESEFNNNSISNWNISKVTNMYFMFEKSKFDGDISSWNFNKNLFCIDIFKYNTNFINKYNDRKKIPNHDSDDFLTWFEINRNKIKEINNPKEEVLDFFSFENNLEKGLI